jgi:hypothetical protein
MPISFVMRIMKALWLTVLLAVLCGPWLGAHAETVSLGSTKDQVLSALGQPKGTLRQGTSERLVYRDVEIDLVNDRVVKVYYSKPTTEHPSAKPREDSSSRNISPSRTSKTPTVSPPSPTPGPNQAQLMQMIGGGMVKHKARPITPVRRAIIIAGVSLFVIGALVAGVAWIWFLIRAFSVHAGWGLACLFLPFAPLVFLFMHWQEGRKPFLVNLAGAAGCGLGLFLAVMTAFAAERAPQSAGTLPKGVVKEGTLANEILIRDATNAAAFKVATLGCDHPDNIKRFYVLSMPEGPSGAMRWKERWIIAGCGREYPVDIVFRQDGLHSATYEVHSPQ